MAGQGTVSIGAVFDKNGVDTGLTDVAAVAKSTMDSIATFAEQAHARTRNAFKGLSDDVKAAAESVGAESLKVAEATKAHAAALSDLRRARVIANDSTVDAATATSILAAAQHKAVVTSEELAEAKKAEAAAVSEGAQEIALSSNAIVAGFQRAGAAVSESLAGMRERMILTSEGAHLSARDITGAFSGLGELFGIGLLADFGGEFLDQMAEMQVALGHLRVETGISATSLAGLQQIVKEMGANWEPVERGLVRFYSAIAEGQAGLTEYTRAFRAVNLTVDDFADKTPEQKLQVIATAFANTANESRVAYAARELFGRGGVELIPVLKEQGEQLTANTKKMGELTGITDQSIEASERWQRDVARLHTQFRSLMIPVLEHAEDVVRGLIGAFDAGALAVMAVFESLSAAVVSFGESIYDGAKIAYDAAHGNFSALVADGEEMKKRFTENWKDAFSDVATQWAQVKHDFTYTTPLPEIQPGVDPGALSPPDKRGRSAKTNPIKADEDELVKLERVHAMTVQEEADFWSKKLAAAVRGSELYAAILRKLAPLEKQLKQQRGALQPEQQTGGLQAAEDAFIASNNAQVRSSQESARQTIEAYRSAREEEIRLAAERYQEIERDSEFEVQMGRMTAQRRIAILQQASIEEERIRTQAMHAIEMVDMQNAQRYQQDMNREVEETQRATSQMVQLQQKAALQSRQKWEEFFRKINSDMTETVNKMLQGTQSIGKDFLDLAKQIEMQLIDLALMKVLKMAEDAMHLGQGQSQNQKQLQSDQKVNPEIVESNAAAAASVVFLTSGGNLAAAMKTFAEGMIFAPMAAFEKGGIVGGMLGMGVPILAHAGERVLTAQQTQNFESLVNNHSSSRGGDNFHLHYNGQVNAFDRTGMRSALKSHAGDILDIVREGWRSGKLA